MTTPLLRRRRRRHGRAPRPTARYYAWIGAAPTHAGAELRPAPADPDHPLRAPARLPFTRPAGAERAAWTYWQRIWWMLGIDGPYPTLSRSERASLQRLEKRWRRRALGQDARWTAGETTRGGRLPAAIEAGLPARDEEPDPWLS
jgi:hypothetical protein